MNTHSSCLTNDPVVLLPRQTKCFINDSKTLRFLTKGHMALFSSYAMAVWFYEHLLACPDSLLVSGGMSLSAMSLQPPCLAAPSPLHPYPSLPVWLLSVRSLSVVKIHSVLQPSPVLSLQTRGMAEGEPPHVTMEDCKSEAEAFCSLRRAGQQQALPSSWL